MINISDSDFKTNKLNKGEILRLMNEYIGVANGYLGDFSGRTLEEFYPIYCNFDVDFTQLKLEHNTNKNKFQHILEQSDCKIQAKILKGIFKKYPIETRPEKQNFFEEYLKIIARLENDESPETIQQINAHFEGIQQQIIEEINKAQHLIWVAVAWFTNKKLFNRLAHRKYEGLTVELILLDDSINRNSGIQYDKYLTVHWVSKEKIDKKMHNKFCVIDLKTCITGSYNWTTMAEYSNKENISIIKDLKTTGDYATEFIKIRKELSDNINTTKL